MPCDPHARHVIGVISVVARPWAWHACLQRSPAKGNPSLFARMRSGAGGAMANELSARLEKWRRSSPHRAVRYAVLLIGQQKAASTSLYVALRTVLSRNVTSDTRALAHADHELTTKEHWDDLVSKPYLPSEELDIGNYVANGTTVEATYDPHCESGGDISGGCC